MKTPSQRPHEILVRPVQTWLGLLLVLTLAPRLALASIVGPYTPDANTLILLHLDDAAGGSNASIAAGSVFAGTNFISVNQASETTTPPPVTTVLGATADTGFGSAATFPTIGYVLGFAGSNVTYFGGDSGSGNSTSRIPMSWLNIGNGGQTPFTLEAMIAPASIYNTNMEIICSDSYASTRGFQFRINTSGQLEFDAITAAADVVADIPTAGPQAFVPNAWYHVAVTYDGVIVRLYWTKVDPSVGEANLIGAAAAVIGTTQGAATGPLCVGNSDRGGSQTFYGSIDEVRLSNIARGPTQMLFSPHASQILTWVGDGANNGFAEGVASNWNNGSVAYAFNAGDTVVINDSSANTNISLWGFGLAPASITISNSAGQYLLQGAGGLAGTSGFTKNGTNTLLLGGLHSYSGTTTISNGAVALPSTPVIYFSFDNTNGNVVVNEGAGGPAFNGTLTGTAAIVPGGRRGNALSIPSGAATAAYVLVSSNSTSWVPFNGSVGSAWTVAMWVSNTTAGGVYLYQGSGSWGSGNTEFYLENGTQADGAGTHQGGVRYGQNWESGTAAINNGAWHFIVMTDNSGAKTMYVDGAVDAILSGTNGSSSWTGAGLGTQLRIGGTAGSADSQVGWGGLIDEFYVFNRALTLPEIQTLTAMTNAPTGAVLPAVAPVMSPASPLAIASGGTLNLNGYNQTNAGLSGAGTVDSTENGVASTLSVSNTGTSFFSGSINNSGGTISNNAVLGLAKLGPGTQILGGADGFAGPVTLANGTLVLTNNGTINISSNNADNLLVGTVSNQSAAFYQYAGTSVSTTNNNLGDFQIGAVPGAAGYYNLSGGTITLANTNLGAEFDVGGSSGGAGTFGQFDMSGGTINLPNVTTTYFLANRGAVGESSVINLSGGTVQILNSTNPTWGNYDGFTINWAAGSQTNVTTISGSAQLLTPSLTVKLNEGGSYNALGNAGNYTTLNLNGGLLQTIGFTNGPAANNVHVNVNFNGGTLLAGTAGNGAFLTNLAGVYVYGGGATVNDNAQGITIGQGLLAPSGSGVSAVAVATGGAGYITPPQVVISGGGGSNATAYAQISGGAVTGIVVTSPGINYSSAPTVTLAGGGYTTAATAGTVTIAPNVSGGLTKLGAGTLDLNSANTYTGSTIVGQGTLGLLNAGSLASSSIVVSKGATFDVSGTAATFTLVSGQGLHSGGYINGSVNTVSGAGIYCNPGGGCGTNTFYSNLTNVSGAITYFNLGTAYNGANDQLIVEGTLSENGQVSINAPSALVNLDTNGDYVLITASAGITGTVSATPLWGTKPLNWKNFTVVTTNSSTEIVLHYTPTTPPTDIGSANPAIVVRNESILVSVIVTPGSGTVTNVSLNAGPIGGPGNLTLVLSATPNVYTNTVTVAPTTLAGSYTLVASVTDTTPLTGTAPVGLTVVVQTDVWDGAGGNGNWDTNPNWTSSYGAYAPGYVGDSLVFAGTTDRTPDMDNNYTVPSLTFSNNAGSFTLGSAENDTLTLSGSGIIANNSANAQTLNMAIGDNGGGLTKTGAGEVTLGNASNSYTGPTTVSAGTLNILGAVSSSNITTVGNAAANASLIVSGSVTQSYIWAGNANGAVGAVYQTGGTLDVTNALAGDVNAGDLFDLGNIAGGYGYYAMLNGTATANGLAIGGENNNLSEPAGTGGNGVMDLYNGTFNDLGWLVMARGATNETGVLNVFGGWLDYAGGGLVNCWGSNQTAIVNILGGVVSNSLSTVGFNPNFANNSNNIAVLNLNGGLAQGAFVEAPYSVLNFNGGTLQASEINSNFVVGLGGAYVYGGGATVNDSGYVPVGLNQSLLAPTGYGVSSISLTNAGSGYIAPPIVSISGGTGQGATALAQINSSSGTVTNLLVTCPGRGYLSSDALTVTLSGGGGSGAAAGTPVLGANASGGLTKTGSGTVLLGGANTYGGNTVVNEGTLELEGPLVYLSFNSNYVSGSTVVNQGSGGSDLNGTLTGTATIVSGGVNGGNALSVPSGSSSAGYVAISSPVVNYTVASTWSWAMWIKTTTAGATYMYQGATAWGSAETTFYLNQGSGTAGTHLGGVRYAQGWETGTAVINDGNWHFIAMTDNDGVRTMYVDGAVDAITINQWSGTGAGTLLYIGGNGTGESDGQVGLGGLIDEVYIYNRALSGAEIQALYGNYNPLPILPTNTTVNVASGATFDVGGLSQTIGGLTGSGAVDLADNSGVGGVFTIADASNVEFDGAIGDNSSGAASVVKAGAGTFILNGTSTYTGPTTVTNGTLLLGASGVLVSPVTIGAAGNLAGVGALYVGVTNYGNLSPGSNATLGTLTAYTSLVFEPGAIATFTLTSSTSGNDEVELGGGNLTLNNTVFHLRAPAALASQDYVLIDDAATITGAAISTPAWDVRPSNYANYTVIETNNQIVLHYSTATAPTATITANPNPLTHNQACLITVTVAPGSPGTISSSSVTLDASSLNLSGTLPLHQVGSSYVFTNAITIPAAEAPGVYAITATVTDSLGLQGTVGTNLTVVLGNFVWDGGSSSDSLWDDNANWVGNAAPGYVGDSVTFANGTRPAPSMDNSYTVTTLSFSNNAGSFTISTADSSTLTNSVEIINNSADTETLNVPVVFSAAATIAAASGNLVFDQPVDNGGYTLGFTGSQNTTMNGVISDTGGLTESGSGSVTLAAANTYSGPTTVSTGTLNLSGSIASTNNLIVGNAVGNSVMNISGAGASVAPYYLLVGNASNSVGAVYQTGGNVNATNVSGYDNLSLGNMPGSFGYWDALGGTSVLNGIAIAGEANNGSLSTFNPAGNGIMEVNGGTVTNTGWLVLARHNNSTNGSETGILNVYSGLLTYAGYGIVGPWDVGETATINILGGLVSDTTNHLGVRLGALGTGTLNLNGGVLQASIVDGYYGPGYYATVGGQLNFNGGTLRASTNNASSFIAVDAAYIYSGGATIDNNGYAITNSQEFLAPTGDGVGSISLANGGAGYIAPPIVAISNGSGSGATAIAQINRLTGAVTNILVTCPGAGYQSSDTLTVTFTGGGGSGASANAPTFIVLSSGGLTSIGAGSLTLAAANYYTGSTVVKTGTLFLASGASLASSSIAVSNGATFDVSAINFTLGAGQTLLGNGTVNGTVTNKGTIAPGTSAAALGTLTFSNSLALQSSGVTTMKLNTALTPGATNDQIICAGTVTYGGTLSVVSLGGTVQAGDTFTLFKAGAYGQNFTSIAGSPGAGLAYSFNPATGVLSVVTSAAPIARLKFTAGPVLSGTSLAFSATNTGAGTVYLLTSTDVEAPLNTWTPIWTNVFGGSSSFTTNLLNAVNPADKQQFYILSTTNK
jgi:autotransporter-associated beta strand protein